MNADSSETANLPAGTRPDTAPHEPLPVYLDARRSLIERALERVLTSITPGAAVLAEAMRYSLLAGGKRLRPVLAIASAEALLPDRAQARALALPCACALEMIHTYSLVHDDLPAMDDDSLRRGRPTSHVRFGDGMAILAGDGLLTEAFALLTREPEAHDQPALDRRKLQTIQLIADAAGAAGMVGGQAIDLHASRPGPAQPDGPVQATPTSFDVETLRDMHARKTGALIQASVLAGATMVGAPDAHMIAMREYGRDIGLAFQIVDDVLDVEGTAATLGKTAGKDAAAAKPTYPALFGLDASKRLAQEAVERAVGAVTSAGIGGHLADIARWIVVRRH